VLVDEEGPFGNPTSDSARTQIRLSTTNVLVIAFAPPSLSRTELERALGDTQATLMRYCGGAASPPHTLPPSP
jgi:DNA/RNA-binding domain of Phe-tRNA-synthetase-like protein